MAQVIVFHYSLYIYSWIRPDGNVFRIIGKLWLESTGYRSREDYTLRFNGITSHAWTFHKTRFGKDEFKNEIL